LAFLCIVLGFLLWRSRREIKRLKRGRITARVFGKVEAKAMGPPIPESYLAALKSLGVDKVKAMRVWERLDSSIRSGNLETQVGQAIKQLGKER
jgi:hypothetical protein